MHIEINAIYWQIRRVRVCLYPSFLVFPFILCCAISNTIMIEQVILVFAVVDPDPAINSKNKQTVFIRDIYPHT